MVEQGSAEALELAEYKALFDLQWTRMREATKAWWLAHPGKEDTLPDLGALLDWLLSERRAIDRLCRSLGSQGRVAVYFEPDGTGSVTFDRKDLSAVQPWGKLTSDGIENAVDKLIKMVHGHKSADGRLV